MGIIQRQSIKSSIYTYTGTIVGFIYTALIWPQFLSKGEIGALNLLVSFSIIFAQLSSLGINNVLIRFFPFFRDSRKKKSEFLFFALLVSSLGFLLVIIIYYSIKPVLIANNQQESPLFAHYFFLILPLTFFSLFFNVFDVYARSLYFSTTGSFLKEFFQRILILTVTLFFIFELIDRQGLFISYTTAICLPAFLMGLFLLWKNEFKPKPSTSFLDKSLFVEMGKVAFFGILTGFGTLAIAQIDKIMINSFLSESETGVYATTFLFGTLIIMPSRAVQRIAPSLIAQAFKEKNFKGINEIYYKSCINQFILALWIFLGIWLNIDNIFRILPQDYISGKYVIFYIGLANVINMAGGMNNSILANSRYYAYNSWFVGLLLVFIILTNLIFIPLWGIVGAAFASAVSTLLYNFIKFWFIYKKFRYQPYNYKYLLLIVTALVVYLLVFLIPDLENLYFSIIVISGAVTLLYLSLVYTVKISADVNQLINSVLRRLINK
ncbi:MAG: MATE family efflux transporter [Candidatus Cyclobacteriaceae bacterium M3_2C_046]